MDKSLQDMLHNIGLNARAASDQLALASQADKEDALTAISVAIDARSDDILNANAIDVEKASERGLTDAMIDRLRLTRERISSISDSVKAIMQTPHPVGQVEETWTRPNGLTISKVKVPLGVIGMIYESRPNVTVDAGALCLWSGNASILRGGSEAVHSNHALYQAIQDGLSHSGVPANSVQLLPTQDRAAVGEMLSGLNGNIDLIIPRGGKGLVARVQTDARVPVLAHLDGLCHTFVHRGADPDRALSILLNAKMRRTGVCGATETVLIDENIAPTFLPMAVDALTTLNCEIRGCKRSQSLGGSQVITAAESDFETEHLAAIINMKVVDDIGAAMAHIARFGSGHTDAIITEDTEAAETFLARVNSAIVMHNTSTQFADGGEFGFGAEIGIATGRFHARGPVGAQHLTTYKYAVTSDGQTRP